MLPMYKCIEIVHWLSHAFTTMTSSKNGLDLGHGGSCMGQVTKGVFKITVWENPVHSSLLCSTNLSVTE